MFLSIVAAAVVAAAPIAASPAATPEAVETDRATSAAERWIAAHLDAFIEAKKAAKAGDHKHAIEILEPFLKDPACPNVIRSWLASSYDATGSFAAAIATYQSMLARQEPDDFNIRQAMGVTYVRWDRFVEAKASLLAAADEGQAAQESGLYSTLADAFSGLKDETSAEVCAQMAAILAPERYLRVFVQIRQRPLTVGARCSDKVSAQLVNSLSGDPSFAVLSGVANPIPQGAAAVGMANASLAFASALRTKGWGLAADRYKSLAIRAVFAAATIGCEKDKESCVSALSALLADKAFDEANVDLHAIALSEEIETLGDLGEFSHAADFALKLAALRPVSTDNPVWLTIARLRRRIEVSVSFDATGALLTNDPLDFLDQETVDETEARPDSLMVDDRVARSKKGLKSGDPIRMPYAATSHSEDYATTGTVTFVAKQRSNVMKYLVQILDSNIRARNLELPVKLMLEREWADVLDQVSPSTGRTLRDMVVAEMQRRVPDIPPTTREAFDAAQKLSSLRERLSGEP